MHEAAALVALAACLGAAVARARWAPDWAVAAVAAGALLATGVLHGQDAHAALRSLGPTVGFLAALLVLAEGCARAGLFQALGAGMARGARGEPRRLLALVFACAAATTAVLSLDATVLLLTPIVFATAARLRLSPRPPVYACSHLANSASLLLPVSNLTNLLAFTASGLSFARFAALMVLPWGVALAVEWLVLSRVFAGDLVAAGQGGEGGRGRWSAGEGKAAALPRFPTVVLALTLAGFGLSSLIGVAPAWIAAGGALALWLHRPPPVRELLASLQPGFLVFVLGLGIVVRAASLHGLSHAIDALVPHSSDLPSLLAIAGLSAVAANLLNNLPATLVLLPVVVAVGHGGVLAMLIGVGVGPNLTYVGSLATLLWRRVVHAHAEDTDALEFLRLGAISVPSVLVASTVALWLALHVV